MTRPNELLSRLNDRDAECFSGCRRDIGTGRRGEREDGGREAGRGSTGSGFNIEDFSRIFATGNTAGSHGKPIMAHGRTLYPTLTPIDSNFRVNVDGIQT